MAKSVGLVITFISLASLQRLQSRSGPPSPPSESLDWWCNKTPYPDTCKYTWQHREGQNPSFVNPNLRLGKSEFNRLNLELALAQAASAKLRNEELGSKCRDENERAAWLDCLEFYDEVSFLLNETLTAVPGPTAVRDSLTWLTAALTYLETCRDGFTDLGVSDNLVSPLLSDNNVSRLVSNALSIRSEEEGFTPRWVSAAPGPTEPGPTAAVLPDLVVAKDGSGEFTTIQAALDVAEKRKDRNQRFVIWVKKGVYEEYLVIGKKFKNLMLVGDGMNSTFITGNRSVVTHGLKTFKTATVGVSAEGFIGKDITFRNTAGPQNHQAVALRSSADKSVFFRCGFEGYQDTLYVHSMRQFYKECYIFGTIDFIFGNAATVLQDCTIYARKPMPRQQIAVTAQSRTSLSEIGGIVIHNSRILASEDLEPVQASFGAYLGRPWKERSRTVYSGTYVQSVVDPAGWLEWNGTFALDTLFYAEYNNYGPGASTQARVKWSGYRVFENKSDVLPFTVENFIDGNLWLPGTGVPFVAGI